MFLCNLQKMITQGVLQCGWTLFWVGAVQLVLLSVLAMVSVDWVGREGPFLFDDGTQDLFANMPQALFTWFQLQTGDEWGAVVWMVKRKRPSTALFFIIALIISFLLNTVITGVMVESVLAIANAETAQEK